MAFCTILSPKANDKIKDSHLVVEYESDAAAGRVVAFLENEWNTYCGRTRDDRRILFTSVEPGEEYRLILIKIVAGYNDKLIDIVKNLTFEAAVRQEQGDGGKIQDEGHRDQHDADRERQTPESRDERDRAVQRPTISRPKANDPNLPSADFTAHGPGDGALRAELVSPSDSRFNQTVYADSHDNSWSARFRNINTLGNPFNLSVYDSQGLSNTVTNLTFV
jgi:hypothetical protein